MTRWLIQTVLAFAVITLLSMSTTFAKSMEAGPEVEISRPKVQIAILLDTSGSMNGLINQAKSELWRIVNEFATAKRDGKRPDLEVALYQYGSSQVGGAEVDFMRQVLPLTTDLDKVSEELFALKTSGSKEYCGTVIDKATNELKWSESHRDYKAIFICGNEAFTQGEVDYNDACKAAIKKGVIVNTIFCGPEEEGIKGKWKDGSSLADGSFTSINQDATVVAIAAPQDKELAELNAKLNKTYWAYTSEGKLGLERQEKADAEQKGLGSANMAQRANAKAQAFYRNESWDLVDACAAKKVNILELKDEQLPEELRGKTDKEKQAWLEAKEAERKKIQDEIAELYKAREKYVAAERRKLLAESDQTLDVAIKNMCREQATKRGFEFEDEQQVEKNSHE